MLLASNHSHEVVICQSHTMKTTGQLDLSGWFSSVGFRWPPVTVPEPPEVGKEVAFKMAGGNCTLHKQRRLGPSLFHCPSVV